MEDSYKLFSEMERFEIINYNDGEKYGYLANNDIIIDEEGNLRILLIGDNKPRFSFLGGSNFTEIPWEYVKKIGTRTIIIDVDDRNLKKTKI